MTDSSTYNATTQVIKAQYCVSFANIVIFPAS